MSALDEAGSLVRNRMMKEALFVGLGGFIGSITRFKLGGLVLHHTANWKFPLSTFVINILGCFVIGVLGGLVEKRDMFSAHARLFLFTGILGGFTTFSAFGFEGVYLFRRSEPLIAVLYAGLSVICGFFAVWIGMRLAAIGPAS
jgi:CrcB protein